MIQEFSQIIQVFGQPVRVDPKVVYRLGDQNPAIRDLKKTFNDIGYSLKLDNNFDRDFGEAIKNFQSKVGLPVNGNMDIGTAQALTLTWTKGKDLFWSLGVKAKRDIMQAEREREREAIQYQPPEVAKSGFGLKHVLIGVSALVLGFFGYKMIKGRK